MSLRWYRLPRMVVLSQSDSVLEAARAIEQNRIGAVIVQQDGRVVGLATDRDLAVRVIGRGLDPKTTRLGDVMTKPVATLSPSDSQADAIRMMRERKIRRIPLVENDRAVGMVTLDDLLLDEAAPLDQLAAVVEAQIGDGGPAASSRSPAARRSAARAQATYGRMLNQLCVEGEFDTAEQAATALEVVVGAIVQRLTPGEARDLIAQLPSLLQPTLRALPPGPDKSISRETIEVELTAELGVDQERAWRIMQAVGAILSQSVSRGQIEDVQNQLPEELRGIFTETEALQSSPA